MKKTIETICDLNLLSAKINPTIIYNEGWMIRLLVIESMLEKIKIGSIDFEKLANKNWSSEALIGNPFLDSKVINRENHTHCDIILGDFKVDFEKSGAIELNETPEFLGIIEAKMKSGLSQGTTNAPNYNQASRNVCCLAHTTQNTNCSTFFIIVAPQKKINKKIETQIKEIKSQIEKRFAHSGMDYPKEIKNKVDNCEISIISYEDWIEKIKEKAERECIYNFYKKCLEYNKIKIKE
jgi:cyclophilin family peptidyl-prolyl cis-trans isomerase